MPLEGLEEEGLPKIPDLQLVQLKFLLTVEDGLGIDKEDIWTKLLEAMTENGKNDHNALVNTGIIIILIAMAPFYSSLCTELERPLNSDLLEKMKSDNAKELEKLQKGIENAEKNFGETEQRDALLAKAEYLSKIGDKVRGINYTDYFNLTPCSMLGHVMNPLI